MVEKVQPALFPIVLSAKSKKCRLHFLSFKRALRHRLYSLVQCSPRRIPEILTFDC